MKHLKKFNEELKPETLRKASRLLKSKGHSNRADELKNWAALTKWKEQVSLFNKWPKVKLLIKRAKGMHGDTIPGWKPMDKEFYLGLIPVDPDEVELYNDILKMNFSLFLIPVEQEFTELILKFNPDQFYNGTIMLGDVTLEVEFLNESPFTLTIDLDSDKPRSRMPLIFQQNRNFVVNIKRHLLDSFSYIDYPSGFRGFDTAYEYLRDLLCIQMNLTEEYGWDMERFYTEIKNLNINDLYND
jgi:hypothetical protein